jgi:outer membrane immunogenic protein
MLLRSILLASAIALGAAAPALAQPDPAGNWTGPYVGVNLGYGGGGFSYPYAGTTSAAGTTPTRGEARQTSTGVLGGIQAGYNYQGFGDWIAGVETDFDGTDIHGTSAFSGSDSSGAPIAGDLASRIDYLGTLRGKAGRAFLDGRMAAFVTGGLAYGQVRSSANFSCAACGAGGAAVAQAVSGGTTQVGWTVGAGADYALTHHLSLETEYLYADLGRDTFARRVAELGAPGAAVFNANVGANTTANILRMGLNYRF